MPDYNIYLHNVGGEGGENKPTKPNQNKNKKTQPTELEKFAKKFSKVAGFISNPDSVIGEAKSTALEKLGAYGLILTSVVKVASNITEKSTQLYSLYTGDYSGVRNWNDLKATVGAVFTPVSTILSYHITNRQIQIANEKKQLAQTLLGDSQINSAYERKV